MHPTLFKLGPLTIASYGFMMMIGFLLAVYTAGRRARKSGANEEFVINLGLVSLISGVLGARIFYVVHHWAFFAGAENPLLSIINVTSGGLEFYGGFLTAVAAVIIYLKLKNKSIRWYLDILAPSIMLGLAFGRIGCFLNGCCWGAVTKSPIAVSFPYGSLAFEHQWSQTHDIAIPAELILTPRSGTPFIIDRDFINITDAELEAELAKVKPDSGRGYVLGLLKNHLAAFHTNMAGLREIVQKLDLHSRPVHPTQIYASITAFLISILLGMYYWRRKRDGMVIAWVFVIYPISRILEEAIRTDNPLDTFGFTISQGISMAVIPLAILFMIILRFFPARSPKAVAEEQANRQATLKDKDKQEIKVARPM
jgi:phosphatidylglycerol:prolipoprotein diacylglycerol transferase